nr:hypothetical protein [Nanoarchaeum sp.]
MKKQHLFIVLSLLILTSCTTYRIETSIHNSTRDTITSLGFQKGYRINPQNKPNLILSKKLFPDSTFKYDKKIKIKKGESLFYYASSLKSNGLVYSGYHRFEEKESPFNYPIDKFNKESAYTTDNEILVKLNQVGLAEINKGDRLKISFVTSDISNILSLLPAIVIIDTTKISSNIVPNNPKNITYYKPKELSIIPEPLVISGNTIEESFNIESDGNLSTQFNVPLTTNLNLNIKNKGFYRVKLTAKNAGWIPVTSQNVKSPLESIFKLDTIGNYITLLDIYNKLLLNNKYRLYTVEEAYVFSELISQTSQYIEDNSAYEGNYGSVITSKGAYSRNDREDFLDSRPVTLVYVALTNDKTNVTKEIIKNILMKKYLIDLVAKTPVNKDIEKVLDGSTINYLKTLSKLQIDNQLMKIEDTLKSIEK